MTAPHPSELWDFDDPAGSEQRFRSAADETDGAPRAVLLTQAARALGLQERYDDAHALLADVAAGDSGSEAEVAVRVQLERGRVHRSAGSPLTARPCFAAAEALAHEAGLAELEIDALHMTALVADPTEEVAITERALTLALAASDPRARDWDASLLNNLGMAHAGAGDHEAALEAFEAAVEACRRIGDPARTRVAWWMVAWSLRHLDQRDRALEIQRRLKAELTALGEEDPYVDEELALLEA